MQRTPKTAPRSINRRALSQKQIAVLPLLPIFNACKAKGLPTDEASKNARLRAVNSYVLDLPIDWIETSFKELLGNDFAIFILADAIEAGCLKW